MQRETPPSKPDRPQKGPSHHERPPRSDFRADRRLEQETHINLLKQKNPGKDRFERIPHLTKEKLAFARKSIDWALKQMSAKVYKDLFTGLGITLKSTDYYLAIAIKESGLDPQSVSSSNAKGLFQIKTGAGTALDDVNRIFSLNVTPDQVFYAPPTKEARRLLTAGQKNALVGILYWHICKDVFRQSQNLQIPREDQDRAAAFIYKLGVGDFSNLWKSLGAKTFTDFATKLSAQLARKFPENFVLPKGGGDVLQDTTYRINYTAYVYTGKQLSGATIQIGSRSYDAANLVQTLRYSEIIQSLAGRQPKPYEVATPSYQLWSIADKLLTRCGYFYGIDYCQKNAVSNGRKIPILIDIITQYNLKIKNPDFREFGDEDKPEGLENGAKVFLPPKEYVEQMMAESQQDVKTEVVPFKPGLVPMYAGRDAAKMEKIGSKLIAPPKTPPHIVTARDPNTHEILDPNDATIYGKMPNSQTKAIIIHSTEGGADSLRHQNSFTHYILTREGVIEVVHNMDIASNHAGASMWEGVNRVAHHTVGIEVVNIAMPRLILEGKICLPLGKNVKVFSAKIGRTTFKLTSTPPAQKVIAAGFKQARRERGFTDKQYAALKDLIAHIGSQKGLRYKDVLTHSMVARGDTGRGRKSDPPVLDWDRLGIPNNHYRVDPDVATGAVKANIDEAEDIRTGRKMTMVKYKGKLYYEVLPSKIDGKDAYSYFPEARFGGTDSMIVGVRAGLKIRQSKKRK